MMRFMRMIIRFGIVACGLCFLGAFGVAAKETPKQNPFTQTLSPVPAAEIPAKAAELVAQAKPAERQPTTIAVVQAAVGKYPSAAPLIVGAIAKAVPAMAATAAATAVGLQPTMVNAIAKAAASAAPTKVNEVDVAVQRQLSVTLAGQPQPATPPAGGPVLGPSRQPPYVPLTGTPGSSTPGTGGTLPPHGRDYAQP
jgi:hypothetical protein